MAKLQNARYVLSEIDPSRLGAAEAEVAFVGRSNVGKSTLLNALCRRPLAKVSSSPGRTRAINVFETGHFRWLVDLPGYGFAGAAGKESEGWGPMIEGYLTGRPNLKAIYTLIDAKVGPTKLDMLMLDWLQSNSLPWRAVATKADQVKRSQSATRRKEIAEALGMEAASLAWVSSESGWGVNELRAEVESLLA